MSNITNISKFSIKLLKDEILNKKDKKNFIITSLNSHISEIINDYLKEQLKVKELFSLDDEGLKELFESSSESILTMVDKKGPFTISEIFYQCELLNRMFSEINKPKKRFIILIAYENSNILFNPFAFPYKKINKDWYQTIIPCEKELIKTINEFIKQDECKLIGFPEDEKKIKFLCNQLYPSNKYRSLEIIKQIKSNVFLLRKIYRDSNNFVYDILKIDSKGKIRKERCNYEKINKDSLNKYLYRVNNHNFFKGNYLGSISTTAITGYKVKTLEDYINEAIKNLNDSNFDNSSENIKVIFKQIHNFLIEINKPVCSKIEDAYVLYSKTILPFSFKMNINELKYIKKVDGDYNNEIIDKPFIINKRKNKVYGKIIEINPNLKKDNTCYLKIKINSAKQEYYTKLTININSDNQMYNYNWPEFFIKNNIYEDITIEISNSYCEGYLNCIFKNLKSIKNIKEFEPNDIKFIKFKDIENKKNIYNNNINPFYAFNSKINGDLYAETSVNGHGDLNLNNILINNKDKDNNPENLKIRIIDLASYSNDIPLMFDYIKMETEIKNHILTKILYNSLSEKLKITNIDLTPNILQTITTILGFSNNNIKNNKSDKFCNEFISFVFDFEKDLFSQELSKNKNIKIKFLFDFILEIRKKAFDRAKELQGNGNDELFLILYKQELFFYSLRTILYDNLSYWAKLWSFIAASVAAK